MCVCVPHPNLKALVKGFEKSGDHSDGDSDAMTTEVIIVY